MSDQFSFAGMAADPTDRLFFAIFPPAAAAARIQSLQLDLRQVLRLGGKPLALDRLHITLCHLGDYAGLPKDLVAKAIEAAAATLAAPFEVTFDRVGSFAGRARNRPFVLRGGVGVAQLEAFQRVLGAEMLKAGLGKWAKPYTPHVTLLYDNSQIADQPVYPVAWTVDDFVLVHSELGRTKHNYLQRWSLKG